MKLINTTTPWFPTIVDELFNTGWAQRPAIKTGTLPAVNVLEEDKAFELQFAVPGKNKNDFTLEIEEGVLTVDLQTSELDETLNQRFTRREFAYEAFQRTFTLPESVDAQKIDAHYTDGVLYVRLPKRKEALPEPKKRISIK